MRIVVRATIPSLIYLFLLCGAAGCAASQPTNPLPTFDHTAWGDSSVSPNQLITVQVRSLAHRKTLPLTGSLAAWQSAEVAANVSGKVITTLVDRGSMVKKAQTLVEVDPTTLQLERDEIKANLMNAHANLKLAQSQSTRGQQLFHSQTISPQDWDKLQASQQMAQASVESLQHQLHLAEKKLADSHIKAPFAGVVAERYVQLGEYVQPPSKVVRLLDISTLRLQMNVPEIYVASLHPHSKVDFSVAAYPGEVFTAEVMVVAPDLRENTRDVLVEAWVDNSQYKLKPGMFAGCHVGLNDIHLPSVPRQSIHWQDGVARVFVLREQSIAEVVVEVEDHDQPQVAIAQGLHEGEQVVLDSKTALRDGMMVHRQELRP